MIWVMRETVSFLRSTFLIKLSAERILSLR
jgi:hypothetical protein